MERLNLEVSGEVGRALERLARETAKGEVLRKAISIANWVDEMKRSGRRIFVEDEKGHIREVRWF